MLNGCNKPFVVLFCENKSPAALTKSAPCRRLEPKWLKWLEPKWLCGRSRLLWADSVSLRLSIEKRSPAALLSASPINKLWLKIGMVSATIICATAAPPAFFPRLLALRFGAGASLSAPLTCPELLPALGEGGGVLLGCEGVAAQRSLVGRGWCKNPQFLAVHLPALKNLHTGVCQKSHSWPFVHEPLA